MKFGKCFRTIFFLNPSRSRNDPSPHSPHSVIESRRPRPGRVELDFNKVCSAKQVSNENQEQFKILTKPDSNLLGNGILKNNGKILLSRKLKKSLSTSKYYLK